MRARLPEREGLLLPDRKREKESHDESGGCFKRKNDDGGLV
jgi:hypothetical protein